MSIFDIPECQCCCQMPDKGHVTRLQAERDRLKAELEEYKFQTRHAVNLWKAKAEKLAEVLTLIVCSNAIDGTLTFSRFPKWFQLRLRDAKEALSEYYSQANEKKKCPNGVKEPFCEGGH